MPKIDDFCSNNKRFQKKRLRAWNVLDIADKDTDKGGDKGSDLGVDKGIVLVSDKNDGLVNDKGIDKGSVLVSNKESNSDIRSVSYKDAVFFNLKSETNNEIYNRFHKSLYGGFKINNTISDLENNQVFNIKNLCGEQLNILKRIVFLCNQDGKTGFLNYSDFIDCSNNKETFKNNIVRLIKKSLLYREKGKRGRSGYFVFSVPDVVLNAFR